MILSLFFIPSKARDTLRIAAKMFSKQDWKNPQNQDIVIPNSRS